MPNDAYVKLQTVVENIVSLTIYESAEEIEKAVKSARYKEDQWIGGIFDAIVSLREIPAADVESVRHGRWEYDFDHIPHCSECGTIALQRHKLYLEEKIYDVPFVLSKRCPECGAKMDAEPPKEKDDA